MTAAEARAFAVAVGQELTATILELVDNLVLLDVGDGKQLAATLQADQQLMAGQTVQLLAVDVQPEQVTLRLVSDSPPAEAAPSGVLAVSVPDTPENRAALLALVSEGLPVTSEAIQQLRQAVSSLGGGSAEDLRAGAFLAARDLPMTEALLTVVRDGLSAGGDLASLENQLRGQAAQLLSLLDESVDQASPDLRTLLTELASTSAEQGNPPLQAVLQHLTLSLEAVLGRLGNEAPGVAGPPPGAPLTDGGPADLAGPALADIAAEFEEAGLGASAASSGLDLASALAGGLTETGGQAAPAPQAGLPGPAGAASNAAAGGTGEPAEGGPAAPAGAASAAGASQGPNTAGSASVTGSGAAAGVAEPAEPAAGSVGPAPGPAASVELPREGGQAAPGHEPPAQPAAAAYPGPANGAAAAATGPADGRGAPAPFGAPGGEAAGARAALPGAHAQEPHLPDASRPAQPPSASAAARRLIPALDRALEPAAPGSPAAQSGAALRQSAERFVHAVQFQQLQTVLQPTPAEPYVVFSLPVPNQQGEADLRLYVRDENGKPKVDPEDLRMVIDLRLSQLRHVMVSVHLFHRQLSCQIEAESLQTVRLLETATPELRDSLRELGYAVEPIHCAVGGFNRGARETHVALPLNKLGQLNLSA